MTDQVDVINAIVNDKFSATELREIIEAAQDHISKYYSPSAVAKNFHLLTIEQMDEICRNIDEPRRKGS